MPLVDPVIVIWTVAVKRLASKTRTTLDVATEDVQSAFRHSAIATKLSICSPIALLAFIMNSLKDLSANAERRWNTVFSHSRSILPTRDDADELDPVAFGQWSLRPFVSMNGEAVVLHQNRLRRQLITVDQFSDRFRVACIDRFAVE